MDCGERVRDKAVAEIGIGSSKPHPVLFATLYFFLLLLTMDCGGRESEYTQKGRAKTLGILGLIIF